MTKPLDLCHEETPQLFLFALDFQGRKTPQVLFDVLCITGLAVKIYQIIAIARFIARFVKQFCIGNR